MRALDNRQPTQPAVGKVDWLAAKLLYIEDHSLSYRDIAYKYGVSLKQVKLHGSRECWAYGRQKVADSVTAKIVDEMVDQTLTPTSAT